MFDLPFDFFSLVIAIVAFIFARKAFNQVAILRARLEAIESTGLQARPGLRELEQASAASSPGVAAEQPATAGDTETIAPVGAAARPPPLPPSGPGFEERIGTRWVVWGGGLTLALGGFFMVRYSIDAGLLG